MALPTLPNGAQEIQYQNLLKALPNNWFHLLSDREGALYPFLWGLAGMLAMVELAYRKAQDAAIPMRSFGPWLSLHLQSIGLVRGEAESDESARTRYQWEFEQTRNTRTGLLRTIQHYTGLVPPQVRLEGDRSTGKTGQFRFVIDDRNLPWNDLDLSFVGELIRRYVANGIIPGLDVRLQCLIVAPLPPWQFHDPFPNTWTVLGPVWERPAFVTELRLDIAQNILAQVSDVEWRQSKTRLRLLQDSIQGNAPGAFFLYLTDPGKCPYLSVLKLIPVGLANPDQLATRAWFPDGFQFSDGLPKQSVSNASYKTPGLEIPAAPVIPSFESINLSRLLTDSENTATSSTIEYRGIDFSRLELTRYADAIVTSDPAWTSPEYVKMRSGNWTLEIGSGDSQWGNFPPQGTTWASTDTIALNPAAIWWTDAEGNARSHIPLYDAVADSVYLAIEFFLPGGRDWTLREMALKLQGVSQNYRRVAVPIDPDIHAGFIFKVQGQFSPT